jgi:O-antigen/teichoic acid export membrane protein
VAGLVVGWILIPTFGANGAAIATVAAFAFAGFGALFFDRRMRRYGRMIVSSVLDVRASISLLRRIMSGISRKDILHDTTNR